ncbi:MAG: alpha/beta hydrolase [Saprospiraceae bacterium]
MKTINIQLQSLPIATPRPATFYLAGNFNHWQPDDAAYRFRANSDGSYQLAFKTQLDRLEYKITRGLWSSAEGDEEGRERPNRIYQMDSSENNLWLQVESWTDAHARSSKGNVLLLHPNFLIPQLGRCRRIWACLPPDYWSNPEKRYPVVYMQDGQNLFDNPEAIFGSWDIDKAMNRLFLQAPSNAHPSLRYQAPILIGIENGGAHRINEYAVWHNPEHGGGEGDQFLEFVCNTLKPFVDEKLRTIPDREQTGVMGSSMGGLFALYAAIERPDVFGLAGVFSPSIWFSKNKVLHSAKNRKQDLPVKILLMAGQQESRDMVSDLLDLYETLLEAGHEEHHLHYDLHSNGVHSEWFWGREFEHALRWLFGEMQGHAHGGISDELIKFRLDPKAKELILNLSPRIQQAHLEIRDYCHGREFCHPLGHDDNRIPYADWENCIYSIRLISEGDLVFSRRLHLNQLSVL